MDVREVHRLEKPADSKREYPVVEMLAGCHVAENRQGAARQHQALYPPGLARQAVFADGETHIGIRIEIKSGGFATQEFCGAGGSNHRSIVSGENPGRNIELEPT